MSKENNYQAIFVDLDNTLTPRKKKFYVSIDNQNALKSFQRKEKYVIISTGRHKKDFYNIWESIYLNKYCDYALYSNGAIIENMKTGEIIYSNLIPETDYLKLLNYIKNNTKAIFKFAGEEVLFKFGSFKLSERAYISTTNYSYKEILDEKDLEIKEYNRQKLGMITSLNKNKTKVIIKELREMFPNLEIVTSGGDLYIEVTNKGVNKGTAAKKIAEHLGIDLQKSIAIGDSMNDYELFKIVGYPIAMKNSSEELIQISKFRTTEAKKNGVATAIEKISNKE